MYFVIFGNLWIWKVFSQDLILFIIAALVSVFLIKALTNKKLHFISIISLILLLIIQIKTTEPLNLTELTNDQIRVRDTRLNEYPPMNLPVAYWLEAKPMTVALTRIRYNFLEQLDPNLYFFANHPRERIGMDEFERFPYVLLPFLVMGVVVSAKNHKFLISLTVLVVLITSLFGMHNKVGNIAMFPPLTAFIHLGLVKALTSIRHYKYKNAVFGVCLIIYVMVLIQTIMYEI